MFLTGDATFASFGVATILVVAIAMLGSLTVLPALLSKLGDRVERCRIPFVGRRRRDDGEGRIWGAIIDRVLRRPLLSAILAGGLLVALALPALQLHMVHARGRRPSRQSLAVVQDLRPHAAGVPRHGAAGQRRRQGARTSTHRRCRTRSHNLEQRASASGRMHGRSRSTSTRTRPSRTSPSRSRAPEPTRRRMRRVAAPARHGSSPRPSARSRTPRPA